MISLPYQGTIAAAGDLGSASFQLLPAPMWINSAWWSFMDGDNGDLKQGGVSTIDPLRSDLFSTTDLTAFTTVASTSGVSTAGVPQVSGNGYITDLFGISLVTKDLNTPAAAWQLASVSSLPGGHIGGGTSRLSFCDPTGEFILHKEAGKDIYKSADARTWTGLNPSTDNNLSTIMVAFIILHNGTSYVAIGNQIGDTSKFKVATSTDLLSWVDEGVKLTGFNPASGRFIYFKGKWLFAYFGGNNLPIYTSTDLITWTLAFSSSLREGFGEALITVDRISWFGSTEVYTTDGVTFSERLPILNMPAILALPNMQIRGKLSMGNHEVGPTALAYRTKADTSKGGKLVEINPATIAATVRYPTTPGIPSKVGLVGGGTLNEYTTAGVVEQDSFYCHSIDETALFYFEVAVVYAISQAGYVKLKIVALDNLRTVVTGQLTELVYNMAGELIVTRKGASPVTTSISSPLVTNDIIGVSFNTSTGVLKVYLNGVEIASEIDVVTNYSLAPCVNANSSTLRLNVGQVAFTYPPGGGIAWGV